MGMLSEFHSIVKKMDVKEAFQFTTIVNLIDRFRDREKEGERKIAREHVMYV